MPIMALKIMPQATPNVWKGSSAASRLSQYISGSYLIDIPQGVCGPLEEQTSAYEKTQAASEARGQQKRINFDLKVRVQDLQPGDKVLFRNLGVPRKHKLADRWKLQPYFICKQLPGLPGYQIFPERSVDPLKTWHNNHILSLSEEVHVLQQPDSQATPPNMGEEDSEDGEMGIDWLWSSPMPETATPSSPFREMDIGILRSAAPEFIPHSQPLPNQYDPQTPLIAGNSETLTLL